MRAHLTRSRLVPALAALICLPAVDLSAAHLSLEATSGWTTYVTTTERRMAEELRSSRGFLGIDFGRDAETRRHTVLAGGVLVEPLRTRGAGQAALDVPSARVHHWRGAVLIPGTTVAQLLRELEHGPPQTQQEDVLQSRLVAKGPDWMRVYLKLHRRRFVTVVYNTEHLVTFARQGATRATSVSTATRIAELAEPGTPEERELPVGDDRGFLWRLNAYWRYEEVAGGVIAECESLTLSRDVPAVVRYLVEPLIESAARDSMERTLRALRQSHTSERTRPLGT